MTFSQMSTRYHATAMELVAYLDEQCVEMHIVTETGEALTVVCPRGSIFKVARQIARMGRECPEIATWGDDPPYRPLGLSDAAPQAAATANHSSRLFRRPAVLAALMPAALLVLALLASGPAAAGPISQSEQFLYQPWAQKHCPADTVVWVNVRSQIYNLRDERWYGQTKGGAFVCKLEAEKAGYRAKPQS